MRLSKQPLRPCPNDDCDGTLREDLKTHESVCDACYHCFGGNKVNRQVRRHNIRAAHREYNRDTYDNGTGKLLGGYETAYHNNGKEYALDHNEDTVLTPHLRNWSRADAD